MNKSKKGFTLAELLIVIGIVAVLVAITVPMISKYVERSRESTDMANVRSAYSQVMAAAVTEDHTAEFNGELIYRGSTSPFGLGSLSGVEVYAAEV